MSIAEIIHRTTYDYSQPVTLNPHRLLVRPRESRDIGLLRHEIVTEPSAVITWSTDVWGNSIAEASFDGTTDRLIVESVAQVDLRAAPWPVFPISADASTYPFRYSEQDWVDLGALTVPSYSDSEGRLAAWSHAFVMGDSTDTLSLLRDIGAGVASAATYQTRDDEGTQRPLETLDRGSGSCRDFATLFVDAVRTLGMGARIVSGYLHDPDRQQIGSAGAGSTHAWAEVFLPGAGWIAFDPTNRSVGGFNLIPVAIGRDLRRLAPVSGSYDGNAEVTLTIAVSVSA